MLMSTKLVKSTVMVAGDGGCVVDCEVDGAMVVIYIYIYDVCVNACNEASIKVATVCHSRGPYLTCPFCC